MMMTGDATAGGVTLVKPLQVKLDPGATRRSLRAPDEAQVHRLLEQTLPLIEAAALYRIGYVEDRSEDGVVIDGTFFKSRVLGKNLEEIGRVFPHVISIGGRLEQRARESRDLLEQYYLDGIGNMALMSARTSLEDHIRERFRLDGLSYMSPGSLDDWPIEAQEPLFSLLGDVASAIGVRLNENLLMSPSKSVSGIYFPTSVRFYNCQLCPRENCEGRRAEYDEVLASEYGILERH